MKIVKKFREIKKSGKINSLTFSVYFLLRTKIFSFSSFATLEDSLIF